MFKYAQQQSQNNSNIVSLEQSRKLLNNQELTARLSEAQEETALTTSELYKKLVERQFRQFLEKQGIAHQELTLDEVINHKRCQPLINLLSQIAFEAIDTANPLTIKYQKDLDNKLMDDLRTFAELESTRVVSLAGNKDYYFAHSTFQEFFAAVYVARSLLKPTDDPSYQVVMDFIRDNKYDPKFAPLLSFCAGMTAYMAEVDNNPSPINTFFSQLLAKPDELIGLHGRWSLLSYFGETKLSTHLKERKKLLAYGEQVVNFGLDNFDNKDSTKIFIRYLKENPLIFQAFQEKITTNLLSKLLDESLDVHKNAAEALQLLGESSLFVIKSLLAKLGDNDGFVRSFVTGVLLKLADSIPYDQDLQRSLRDIDILKSLLAKLGDSDERARIVVSKVFVKLADSIPYDEELQSSLRDTDIIDSLLAKLGDSDGRVRITATELIIKLVKPTDSSDPVLKGLLRMVGDSDIYVSMGASYALSRLIDICSPDEKKSLWVILKDNGTVSSDVADALLNPVDSTPPLDIETLLAELDNANAFTRGIVFQKSVQPGNKCRKTTESLLGELRNRVEDKSPFPILYFFIVDPSDKSLFSKLYSFTVDLLRDRDHQLDKNFFMDCFVKKYAAFYLEGEKLHLVMRNKHQILPWSDAEIQNFEAFVADAAPFSEYEVKTCTVDGNCDVDDNPATSSASNNRGMSAIKGTLGFQLINFWEIPIRLLQNVPLMAKQLQHQLFPIEQPVVQPSESHKADNSLLISDPLVAQLPSSSLTMNAEESNQSVNEQTQPHCMPALYGEEQIPILQCRGPGYFIHVFPKIAPNTQLSTVQMPTSVSGITGDTYSKPSCRPVEFYGQSSISCEGEEQTTAIYTPILQARPLENLGPNIMLAAVAIKLGSNFFGWLKGKIMGESVENFAKQPIITVEYFQAQRDKFLQQLDCIEDKIKAFQNKNNQIDLSWAEFALENYRDEIDDFVRKGCATQDELDELREDICYFKEKFDDDIQITDTVIHTQSTVPVVSNNSQSFFYDGRTTVSYHACNALPVTVRNSTTNTCQGLNYFPKLTK